MQMTTVTPWMTTSRESYQDPGKAGRNATEEARRAYHRNNAVQNPKTDPYLGRGWEVRFQTLPSDKCFAVKSNIDVQDIHTSLGVSGLSRMRDSNASAKVVQLLKNAGYTLAGITRMDQLAMGLSGIRDHTPPLNPLNPEYITGGSSSGSAVVVANNDVPFALGTDMAGSGRIPAAMTGIIGLKPAMGVFSMEGVADACPGQDTVSVFSRSLDIAVDVYNTLAESSNNLSKLDNGQEINYSVPSNFLGKEIEDLDLFQEAMTILINKGGTKQDIDFTPFIKTGKCAFRAWGQDRYNAVKPYIEQQPPLNIHEKVLFLLKKAGSTTPDESARKKAEVTTHIKAAEKAFNPNNVLVVPTVAKCFTVAKMRENDNHNAALGEFVNFANIMDLASITIPFGRRENKIPFSLTLYVNKGSEQLLINAASRLINHGNSL